MMPVRAHRLLIPLAALLAILPLLIHGPSCGHDFDFHILSWFEAATQFAHLHYPHWAYTPAFNAGEPRFLFYPPLSWSLGAILGLILPWNLVPAAFTFLALTLSGFTAHRLASRYAGPHAATLAALLYLTNPYMLFTAYERTAYGELLAAAWLPLLFLAALAPQVRIVSLAIPIALLWLTNAPAAVMSCYALALLTALRLLLPKKPAKTPNAPFSAPFAMSRNAKISRLHVALNTLAATALGLTLPAFYLVPAAYERRYIQSDMATIVGMRIADNTLFHHMPPSPDNLFHDQVLHTASLIALTTLLAIAAAFLLSQLRNPVPHSSQSHRDEWDARPLALLTAVIALLLTPIALPVWAHTPELRFLQFPWRLTALLATILALFAARAFDRLKLKPIPTYVAALAIAVALISSAWQNFHQPCDPEDALPARLALYHSNLGTDPTDEYTPTSADNEALKQPDPPYWLANTIDAPAPPSSTPGQAPTHLTLTLTTPEYLILNRRDFPDWLLTLNGSPVTHKELRNDGLITLLLPAGSDTIDLTQRLPPDQTAGLALTTLAVALALYLARKDSGGPSSFR